MSEQKDKGFEVPAGQWSFKITELKGDDLLRQDVGTMQTEYK